MSKVFQILDGFCHWDATERHHSTVDIPTGEYHPSILFVDAPDYVFEGWGFDADADGNARFIQPTLPYGWLYDVETGTFYPDPNGPYASEPQVDLLADAYAQIVDLKYHNLLLKGGVST